jgi:uncharacterized damage-inducible protein DinB
MLLAVSLLLCQDFSPSLPPAIPAVEGAVVERAPLRYIEVAAGDGAPAEAGRRFRVHYTGWLRDGTKFDSSVDRNQPFEFVQGRRQVITGWDIGFEGMRVGGKRRLFIPYELAYGEKGTGPIPARAELIFDVELLDVTEPATLLPAEDLLTPLRQLRERVQVLADAIPEDKYSWRPAEGSPSIREVLLRIAYRNTFRLRLAQGNPDAAAQESALATQREREARPLSKDQALAEVNRSFDALEAQLEKERVGTLAGELNFLGRATTRRGVLVDFIAEIAEQVGQLTAYGRMNGVAPAGFRP